MFFTPRKQAPLHTQALHMDLLEGLASLKDPLGMHKAGYEMRRQYQQTDDQKAAHTRGHWPTSRRRKGRYRRWPKH